MSAIQIRTRKTYFAPTRGRSFLTLSGACNAEANALMHKKYPPEQESRDEYGRIEQPSWSFFEDEKLVEVRNRLARRLNARALEAQEGGE